MRADTQQRASVTPGELPFEFGASEILDNLDVAVLVSDRSHNIRYRNAAARQWLPDAENLPALFGRVRFLESGSAWKGLFARLWSDGKSSTANCILDTTDGSPTSLFWLRCIPLYCPQTANVVAAILLLEGLHRPSALDSRAEVSGRLASLGKLAARVAHELNNPLDGILRYVNLAMRAADTMPDDRLKAYLSESRIGLIRMVQIVADLLDFSRASENESEETNINELVGQAIQTAASGPTERGIEISTDFQQDSMPSVCGGRLYQVCCNLIKNAVDAMPEGGRLHVSTAFSDGEVIIRVTDTGVGLPDPPDKVFEPFFTTKPPGKGTGLGLAICKDFVEGMGGTITASSSEHGGAVFFVRMPAARLPSRGGSRCQSRDATVTEHAAPGQRGLDPSDVRPGS